MEIEAYSIICQNQTSCSKFLFFSYHKNQRLDNFVLTDNIQILESSKFLPVYQVSLSFARRVAQDVHLVSIMEVAASITF